MVKWVIHRRQKFIYLFIERRQLPSRPVPIQLFRLMGKTWSTFSFFFNLFLSPRKVLWVKVLCFDAIIYWKERKEEVLLEKEKKVKDIFHHCVRLNNRVVLLEGIQHGNKNKTLYIYNQLSRWSHSFDTLAMKRNFVYRRSRLVYYAIRNLIFQLNGSTRPRLSSLVPR